MTGNGYSKLYHAELGFPKDAQVHYGQLLLEYSKHALKAATDDRYGHVNLPSVIDTCKAQVIEIEMLGNKTVKVLYRLAYDEVHDLLIALVPDRRYVKTVWLNRRDDPHSTLDPSRYDIPQ